MIINSVICMGANAFRVYLISRFMKVFFRTEEIPGRKIILAYGLFYAVNTFLYLTLRTAFINIACNLVGIFLLTLLYPAQIRMKLFVTVIICALSMACDVMVVRIFVNYQDGEMFNQVYQVIIVLLFFVCEIIVEKALAYREKQEDIHNVFLLIVPICSIFMLRYMTKDSSDMDSDAVIAAISVLVMNFCVFYLYHLSIKAFSAKYENIMLKQNLKAYMNQLELISQTEGKVKSLRHDMRHHINELQILEKKNNIAGIKKYLASMQEYLKTPDEIIESGDVEIDSLLNYMLAQARKEQISVRTEVRLSDVSQHSFDINIILGNLLENAIEAARQAEEKKLSVNIKEEKGILKIHVENSYSGTLRQKGTKLLTTKKDSNLHGLGLGNVENIVQKYYGTMKIEKKDRLFSVQILLYLG